MWTCRICGKKYKAWTGFTRHPCAKEIGDEVTRAINEEDKDALHEILKMVRSWANGDCNADCNDDAH